MIARIPGLVGSSNGDGSSCSWWYDPELLFQCLVIVMLNHEPWIIRLTLNIMEAQKVYSNKHRFNLWLANISETSTEKSPQLLFCWCAHISTGPTQWKLPVQLKDLVYSMLILFHAWVLASKCKYSGNVYNCIYYKVSLLIPVLVHVRSLRL